MQFHFISGLPRAGSSLLAAILQQNPRFHAHIQSPVGQMITDLHHAMSGVNEAHWFIDNDQRLRILRGVFSAYYAESREIVFDTNRRWCANIALVRAMFPEAWVLACVRSPVAVVDSLERLLQNHPLTLSTMIGLTTNTTVFERVKRFMAPEGLVGYAWNATQSAYYGQDRNRLIIVNYDDLARFPGKLLVEIHEKLELPAFEYDFENIEQLSGTDLFDQSIGTPGLHSLKKRVEYVPRTSVLPPAVIASLPRPFWERNVKAEA